MNWPNKFKNFWLYFLGFLFIVSISSVQAETLFEVKPDKIPYFKENKILALWNPKGIPEIHKPGLKIYFFGKAQDCLKDAANAKVEITTPPKNIEDLVGIKSSPKGQIFIPVQDERFCSIQDKPKKGGSFVYINEDAKDGGIGLFTASGIDENGERYFFTTRDEEGVGRGVNKYEKNTSITWKLEKEKYFPFKGEKKLKLLSRSSVTKLPLNIPDDKKPVQVRQQIEIGSYERQKPQEIVEDLNIHLVLFHFIWPKIFSVVEEVMSMSLPIVAFNISAPAERLKTYTKAKLIDMSNINAENIINAIKDMYEEVYRNKAWS